jgi:drug/metabolite transporter (DMT)-like permease
MGAHTGGARQGRVAMMRSALLLLLCVPSAHGWATTAVRGQPVTCLHVSTSRSASSRSTRRKTQISLPQSNSTTSTLPPPPPLSVNSSHDDGILRELLYQQRQELEQYLFPEDEQLLSFLAQGTKVETTVEPPKAPLPVTSTAVTPTLPTPPDDVIMRARLLLLGAAALYGTNFAAVKLLVHGADSMPVGVSSTLRFGLAALATLPWLLKTSDNDNTGDATTTTTSSNVALDAVKSGLEVGMWNSLGYVAQAVGLEMGTQASTSAFLCSLAVVVVPLLDWTLGHKKLSSNQLVGTAAALAGVALLELTGTGGVTLSAGDAVSLIQPLAFGLGFWRMEAAMQRHPQEAARSTAAQLLAVFFGSLAYAAVTTDLAHSFSWDALAPFLQNPLTWAGLIWTGVVTTALSVYMETVALRTLSAAETTLIFSTEPLWGTAFAVAALHEDVAGVATVAGAVLILSGCLYSNLGWAGIQGALQKFNPSAPMAADQAATMQAKPTRPLPRAAAALPLQGAVQRLQQQLAVAAVMLSCQWNNFMEMGTDGADDVLDVLENLPPPPGL